MKPTQEATEKVGNMVIDGTEKDGDMEESVGIFIKIPVKKSQTQEAIEKVGDMDGREDGDMVGRDGVGKDGGVMEERNGIKEIPV